MNIVRKYTFLLYRALYNFLGKISRMLCGILGLQYRGLPDWLWIDFPTWHKLDEHPCHRASEWVRHIYFCTGLLPKPEYIYLLDCEGAKNTEQANQPDSGE